MKKAPRMQSAQRLGHRNGDPQEGDGRDFTTVKPLLERLVSGLPATLDFP